MLNDPKVHYRIERISGGGAPQMPPSSVSRELVRVENDVNKYLFGKEGHFKDVSSSYRNANQALVQMKGRSLAPTKDDLLKRLS